MHLLPLALRFALLCSLALVVTRSSVHGDCSDDHYWDSDPESKLTWYPRGAEIPLRLSLPKALEAVRHALQDGGLPPCDTQKDLTSQKLKIVAAFRSDAGNKRIPDRWGPAIQDHSQVMVRIIDRSEDGYAVQILSRSKWARGHDRTLQVADQDQRCVGAAMAGKVRSNLLAVPR